MKIRFAVTFSLIMGCAQPSEHLAGSSVNAAGAIQQASTSQNIYGGFESNVKKTRAR